MNQLKQPGYTLLFVLLTVSALMLYCAALFRSSFFILTLPFLRTETVQREYLVQGLLEYGIAFCVENKNNLFLTNTQREIMFSAKQWPPGGNLAYSGTLAIQPVTQNQYRLNAQLHSNESTAVCTASCCVTLVPKSNTDHAEDVHYALQITNWSCPDGNNQ